MGLANLVPGISGGTMLVAAGVYPRFIEAIAELTGLRFRRASVLLLIAVLTAAVLAILLFAGPIRNLVVEQRWIMYSLFIGLTLGGAPVLWRMLGGRVRDVLAYALIGFIGMSLLALLQAGGGASADRSGFLFLLLAGAIGAGAMILPGISGGYLLVVLGVYVPILTGIAALLAALQAGDLAALLDLALTLVLPVGMGVVIGVVAVSHLLRWLLARFERQTLGVLLGLLLGAVVGLWPFQHGVPPAVGTLLKGQTVAVGEGGQLLLQPSGRPLAAHDYPTVAFPPSWQQLLASLALLLGGFAATSIVDRLGRESQADRPVP
jgi:putative membrane protein